MSARAIDIAYVHLAVEDLDRLSEFIARFGMTSTRATTDDGRAVLYSSGTDGAPYQHVAEQGENRFVGVAFEVERPEDLEALAAVPGASEIEDIQAPGGGRRVRFTDPNGYEVSAIQGWQRTAPSAPQERPPINTGTARVRLREPVRLETRPSQVKRLGHCVLFVQDFRESEAWYKERFGFLTSDAIHAGPEENVIGAFMRCDRGDMPVDHHTLFLLQGPGTGMQHAAFEVHDWDDLMLGHDALEAGGYNHNWGIGKHILGSQVFDYWHDPFGNVMEHFTDGDLFDSTQAPGLMPIQSLLGVQWGARMQQPG
ncbi:MAG: glyoxalase [Gammaproteobacteria bacterium]|nr:glyoxalase [Gammaproteobacteria bacterium]